METCLGLLVFGAALVLPQVVGFAVSRMGRRRSVVIWPLAAAGFVGLLGVLGSIFEHRAEERAAAAGGFSIGPAMVGLVAFSLMVLHFAVGAILGVLDRRVRARRANC